MGPRLSSNGVLLESQRDPDFTERLVSSPPGEKILSCIQCGTCSSTCPLSHYMDYTPRRLIYLAREGFKDLVLRSRTPWICASCFNCVVQCPAVIDISGVMHLIRRTALAEGTYPRDEIIPALSRSFYEEVVRHGRINEARVALGAKGIGGALGMMGLGLKLWRKGRVKLSAERMRDPSELRDMLREVSGE
ncbi:MAG: 4Fe-4S dicluster domain-containing protein [Candidatus Korarchaeota archaeon]|nr:4Fe-4S dicluster domain-containing protein [Candidatus Korarchaeota archaeon]